MPIPEIEYDDQAVEMLPTEQRLPLLIVMARVLVSAVKWLHGVFKGFVNGDTSDPYDSTITYSKGNRAVYNFEVYESLIDGNLGSAPDINPDKWFKYNDHFIGAMERVRYNGSKIVLTWALNRQFRTEFRQPPALSEIYITNDVPESTSFVMYPDSARSSKMFPTYSTGYMYTTPVFGTATTYKFKVHVPSALHAALGPTADSIISNFIDRYNFIGISYTIVTY